MKLTIYNQLKSQEISSEIRRLIEKAVKLCVKRGLSIPL